jgi:hypothetical protein
MSIRHTCIWWCEAVDTPCLVSTSLELHACALLMCVGRNLNHEQSAGHVPPQQQHHCGCC